MLLHGRGDQKEKRKRKGRKKNLLVCLMQRNLSVVYWNKPVASEKLMGEVCSPRGVPQSLILKGPILAGLFARFLFSLIIFWGGFALAVLEIN